MRAISSKLNMYVRNAVIINNSVEKLALNIIFWSFGALSLLYIIFLGTMVKDIVERQSLEVQSRNLATEVGGLELTYLTMSNDIDVAFSQTLGFKEIKPTFTTRKSLGLKTNGSSNNTNAVQHDL